jgi:hypothetical protein
MTMTTPSPLMHYDGRTAIGISRDWGPNRCEAIYILPSGKHEPLGFHKDRRAARLAIEARHAGGPEPPRAA